MTERGRNGKGDRKQTDPTEERGVRPFQERSTDYRIECKEKWSFVCLSGGILQHNGCGHTFTPMGFRSAAF